MKKIAILGTVGVPASYGGFETLVDNIVRHHDRTKNQSELTVFCSGKHYKERPSKFFGADLIYLNLSANGVSSIVYDVFSLIHAVRLRFDAVLLLGVSGAIAIPFVRLFSNVRVVTNIDGVEWKRQKWNALAKKFLQISEWFAVKFSHEVVADNIGISNHVLNEYSRDCRVIAYGGDHALSFEPKISEDLNIPDRYALGLCRIEPENNVHLILEAFSRKAGEDLVFVGNWDSSSYGKSLKKMYSEFSNMYLLDPIYEPGLLRFVRGKATLYVHGHSAGGTNPSLVEMMHFGVPVIAYDCCFNRFTTENKCLYFNSADLLCHCLDIVNTSVYCQVGENMSALARERYTWDFVSSEYFKLL